VIGSGGGESFVRAPDRDLVLRWIGILGGLTLVVVGLASTGTPLLSLPLATGGAIVLFGVALIRRREPPGSE
jgi:hypothetical protein